MFEAVHLTKSNDIDKYKYSGYGTGFDRKGKFSVDDEFGRNCIIFGADMSSSVHLDNKKKKSNASCRSYTRIRWHYINCRKKVFN